jgi:hypothetical protein
MATNTYVELKKETVAGTSTTSVTLSVISGEYTDLRLVINSQNQNSTYQPYIQFNADTGTGTTNYSTTSLAGNGSNGVSNRHTSNIGWYPVPGPGVGTTGNFQPWTVDIMNYSNTTTYKSGVSRFNNTPSILSANVHLWRSTAAISSITITAEAGAGYIVPGSTFSLYGIRAEGVTPAPKATGGTIYSDSNYYYHAFSASGLFTPSQALTVDYLVIAGGGGGSTNEAGGGGAGGLRSTLTATGGLGSLETPLSLSSATQYTVTVGGGGNAAGTNGVQGSNSVFASITSTGGGGGGNGGVAATSGGSGGGGGAYGSNAGGARTASPQQGFAGGSGSFVNGGAGGGGGAGAVGINGSGTYAGNGGIGLELAVFATATGTGVNNYYAGGGGGGAFTGSTQSTGGLGGGGNGGAGTPTAGSSALTNTGGGGGGGGTGGSVVGGNGGSGLVIIRYAK